MPSATFLRSLGHRHADKHMLLLHSIAGSTPPWLTLKRFILKQNHDSKSLMSLYSTLPVNLSGHSVDSSHGYVFTGASLGETDKTLRLPAFMHHAGSFCWTVLFMSKSVCAA